MFCQELKSARKELSFVDVLSRTTFDVFRQETLIPAENIWRPSEN